MIINISHFDTKLQIPTYTKEQIKNCLAEYLFADTEFAITHIDVNSTTPAELEKYKDMTAQFSNGKKVYFASEEIREKVYPVKSDGAAYGSLVFTPCKDFKELKNLRILVVNDETGENGGLIPNDQAKKLVGDCYGRMSPDLALELTNTTNTPFQFRLGIKPQEGNDVHRIAKGTLAPARELERLGQPKTSRTFDGKLKTKIGYDLVLASSSFKGRKGASSMQPGEYTLTLGIGVKTLATYGKHSLGTQVLVNYPKGVEADILPKLESAASLLASIQSDPQKVAQYFIDKNERQLQLSHQNSAVEELETLVDIESFDRVFDIDQDQEATDNSEAELEGKEQVVNQNLYNLLKVCVQNHPQLLEHPNVVSRLTTLIRKEWTDIATGRAIEFQSGLAQPSLELQKDEVCVPHFPEGEKLIVTRSPLINSNGVIILTNKHLPEFANEQGTIHIHPLTAAAYLQADFDGDRLAYEKACLYPTLAAEIEEKQLPGNRHSDVIKAEKQAYVADTFGEIALAASSNQIGIIANSIQQAVAIENKIDQLPDNEKIDFLFRLKGQCLSALNLGIDNFNLTEAKKQQCLSIQDKASTLASFADSGRFGISKGNVNENLQLAKQLLFETVDILSNELQTAADGPKSAARPNEDVLKLAKTILDFREVAWISDKKNQEVYKERIMETKNYSPVDTMIHLTNQVWQEHHLESLPTHQFSNFFSKNYTPVQEETAKQIIKTYNSLYTKAVALKEQATHNPGWQLIATSAKSGKQIVISNLAKYNHPDVWKSDSLNIKLVQDKSSKTTTAFAQLKSNPTEWQTLGTVTLASVKEHNLSDGFRLTNAKIQLIQGITNQEIKAKFQEARNFAEQVKNQYSSLFCYFGESKIRKNTHTAIAKVAGEARK